MVAEYFFPGPNRGSQQSDTIYLLTRIHPRLQTAAGLNSHDNISSLISNSRNTLTVGPVSKEMVNLSSSSLSHAYPQNCATWPNHVNHVISSKKFRGCKQE